MKIQIQVNNTLTQLEQFSNQLNIPVVNDTINIPKQMGSGFIKQYRLPYQIVIHHYSYHMLQSVVVESENLEEDGLYMVQVNLSNRVLNKSVDGQDINFSIQGKSGALYYSPGNNSRGGGEIGKQFELVFFTFPKETYDTVVNGTDSKELASNFCLYTELPRNIEIKLKEILLDDNSYSLLTRNGKLLEVLDQILKIFDKREFLPTSKLKMNDIEKLFQIKGILENSLYGNLPSIQELAQTIAVSETKLKSDFKSLFGTSIYKYYLLLKMEVAKKLIEAREGTISEISFRLGYSNPAQFSAQFRKQHGVAPSKI